MKVRIITGVVALLVFIPVLVFSYTIVFQLAMAILCFVGVYEMLKCLGYLKRLFVSVPCLAVAAAFPTLAYFFGYDHVAGFLLLYLCVFVVLLSYLFAYAVLCGGKEKFSDVASVFVTMFYIIGGFSSLSMIRLTPHGAYMFVIPFLGAWLTDTFAYFTGFFLGKHKLCPEISPKKTVEGCIGGTIGGTVSIVIFGMCVGHFTNVEPNYLALTLGGVFASLSAQIGDLIASLIKREYGIKDYGTIFPGHGGVLDRFDSVIAVSAATLILCLLPEGARLFA